MIIYALISVFVWLFALIAPIVLIVLLIRHFSHRNNPQSDEPKPQNGLRDIFILGVMLAATVAGIAGIVFIPIAFFGVKDITTSGLAMTVYLVSSMLLLMSGIFIKEATGKFLMVIGIITLFIGVIPYISQYKTAGGFIIVLIVFIALVGLIIRATNKEKNG